MKKKAKDLEIGDQIQLFTKVIPVPVPYEVTLIEIWKDTNTVSGLHLKSPDGNKRAFSFLDGDLELEMWVGYDVGSAIGSYSTCSHCGKIIK